MFLIPKKNYTEVFSVKIIGIQLQIEVELLQKGYEILGFLEIKIRTPT